MSKKIETIIGCPKCHIQDSVELFHSLWVDDPSNLERIERDNLNVVGSIGEKFNRLLDLIESI